MEVGYSDSEEEFAVESQEQVELRHTLLRSIEVAFGQMSLENTPNPEVNKHYNTSAELIQKPKKTVTFSDQNEHPASKEPKSPAGIKEGKKFDFHSEEIIFALNERPIELYRYDIVKDHNYSSFLKNKSSDFPFHCFDRKLINNLEREGVTSMRPVQIATLTSCFIAPAPYGKKADFVGVSMTGSGKTYGFLVPMIQKCMDRIERLTSTPHVLRKPLVLIFGYSLPLLDALGERAKKLADGTGVKIELISGQRSFIKSTNFDMAICTVGRFKNHFNNRGSLSVQIDLSELEYLVVDEADKMAVEDDFVKLCSEIKSQSNKEVSTMLFSATYDTAATRLFDTNNHYGLLCGQVNRVSSSVKMCYWAVNSKKSSRIFGMAQGTEKIQHARSDGNPHPFDALYVFVSKYLPQISQRTGKPKNAIIFVKRQAIADLIARRLTSYGFPAVAVHAKQEKLLSNDRLRAFRNGEVRILIATLQLSRGTDIEIDFVVNYDLPIDYTDFVHRCGRTGRNGNSGTAITFYDLNNPADYNPRVLQKIAKFCDINHAPDDFKNYAMNATKLFDSQIEQIQRKAEKENDDGEHYSDEEESF